MKYYVIRISLITGIVEYRGNKRGKYWSKAWAEEHIELVPQFTKRGAKGICDRACDKWHWIYAAIPATAFD